MYFFSRYVLHLSKIIFKAKDDDKYHSKHHKHNSFLHAYYKYITLPSNLVVIRCREALLDSTFLDILFA